MRSNIIVQDIKVVEDVKIMLAKAKSELEHRRGEILELRRALHSAQQAFNGGDRRIAIVGASVWLPGSITSIDQLWSGLIEGAVFVKPIEFHHSNDKGEWH